MTELPEDSASTDDLVNPVWTSLIGADARFALGDGPVRRYRSDVTVFAGVEDPDDPTVWPQLADLVGNDAVALFNTPLPPGWTELRTLPTAQMAWMGDAPSAEPAHSFTPLGPDDGEDMLALVERTEPGPFGRETIQLGGYRGLRVDGELVCMGGERMHPGHWTEVSAVCTRPGSTGRGLGTAVVLDLVRDILGAGRRPFLHVMLHNERARTLYSRLGFDTVDEIVIRVVTPDHG